MSEYIKREDAAEAVEGWGPNDLTEAILADIKTIPAADVRPVVVCADCKHNNACLTQAFVEDASRLPFDRSTFFCADGKRADDV